MTESADGSPSDEIYADLGISSGATQIGGGRSDLVTDVDAGEEHSFVSPPTASLALPASGELKIDVHVFEEDTFSDDDLGVTSLALTQQELRNALLLPGHTVERVMPRHTADGEYAMTVVITVD